MVHLRLVETIKYLTQEELSRLFKVIDNKRDKAIFLIAYRHGLRASEIGNLRRSDLDFGQQRIHIHRLKGSLSGEHPLSPSDSKALKSYLRTRTDDSPILFPSRRGDPISRITLYKMTQRYGDKAGIPKDKQKFHALKHSIATHMLDAGAELMFVKDWLGHKDISNTIIYTQLTNPTRAEHARRVVASPKIVG